MLIHYAPRALRYFSLLRLDLFIAALGLPLRTTALLLNYWVSFEELGGGHVVFVKS